MPRVIQPEFKSRKPGPLLITPLFWSPMLHTREGTPSSVPFFGVKQRNSVGLNPQSAVWVSDRASGQRTAEEVASFFADLPAGL